MKKKKKYNLGGIRTSDPRVICAQLYPLGHRDTWYSTGIVCYILEALQHVLFT